MRFILAVLALIVLCLPAPARAGDLCQAEDGKAFPACWKTCGCDEEKCHTPEKYKLIVDCHRKLAQAGDARALEPLAVLMTQTYLFHGAPEPDAPLWIRKAAEAGSPAAEEILAESYYYGGDPAQALVWYRKAAKDGDQMAASMLPIVERGAGICHLNRTDDMPFPACWEPCYCDGACYKQPQYGRVLECHRKLAKGGDANAAWALAQLLAPINPLAPRDGEAFQWWRKAAEGGIPVAQFRLAMAYERGDTKGVPKDRNQAIAWYQKAALAPGQWGMDAQSALGLIQSQIASEKELGVDDFKSKRVCKNGVAFRAYYRTPFLQCWDHCACSGEDCNAPKNYVKGMDCLRKLAGSGNADAAYELERELHGEDGHILGEPGERAQWLRAAADAGNPMAEYDLGEAYTFGEPGIPVDGKQAMAWFTKAAASADVRREAKKAMGHLYANGIGVDKDISKAEDLYAAGGDYQELGGLYAAGTDGFPQDWEKAYFWYRVRDHYLLDAGDCFSEDECNTAHSDDAARHISAVARALQDAKVSAALHSGYLDRKRDE